MADTGLLKDAEDATGFPLRLAYLAITAKADRHGVLPSDPLWLEEHAAPNDTWPWVDIIECFVAMAYVDIFTTPNAFEGETSFIYICGWKRLQAIARTEKQRWPAPQMTREHLNAAPLPASLMRRAPAPMVSVERQYIVGVLPPLIRMAEPQNPESFAPADPRRQELLDALMATTNRPQGGGHMGLKVVEAVGVPLDIIVKVAAEHVASAPAPIKSWADPWLMPLYRREMQRG